MFQNDHPAKQKHFIVQRIVEHIDLDTVRICEFANSGISDASRLLDTLELSDVFHL